MIRHSSLVAIAAVFAAWACAAHAEDNLKVGIIATLSGPPAVLGQQLRNGFQLAVKDLGGKLGGREAEIFVVDDELKPDVAVTKVKSLIDRDKVDFVVGPIFSNILGAIAKPVTEAGVILISPNAGTSTFAGKEVQPEPVCHLLSERPGARSPGPIRAGFRLQEGHHHRAELSGRQRAAAGFKHKFSGEIADEIYVPLGQPDYSAELTRIAAASPDAIFAFLPGGMGVNFVKQFRQAGLADKIPFLSAFTVDGSTLPAQQDAALGMLAGSDWAPNLDHPQNKAFVDEYVKEYNAVPATYAFQAYDAAMLIDSAVRAVKGNVADKDALRAALKKDRLQVAAARSSSTPTITRSRTSIWPRSPSVRTANTRPRSSRRCSRGTATPTPKTA